MTSPLLLYQTVDRMYLPTTDIVLMQVCTEQFPSDFYKHGFTVVILIVQYIVPLLVLPFVHTKILVFLRHIKIISYLKHVFWSRWMHYDAFENRLRWFIVRRYLFLYSHLHTQICTKKSKATTPLPRWCCIDIPRKCLEYKAVPASWLVVWMMGGFNCECSGTMRAGQCSETLTRKN